MPWIVILSPVQVIVFHCRLSLYSGINLHAQQTSGRGLWTIRKFQVIIGDSRV